MRFTEFEALSEARQFGNFDPDEAEKNIEELRAKGVGIPDCIPDNVRGWQTVAAQLNRMSDMMKAAKAGESEYYEGRSVVDAVTGGVRKGSIFEIYNDILINTPATMRPVVDAMLDAGYPTYSPHRAVDRIVSMSVGETYGINMPSIKKFIDRIKSNGLVGKDVVFNHGESSIDGDLLKKMLGFNTVNKKLWPASITVNAPKNATSEIYFGYEAFTKETAKLLRFPNGIVFKINVYNGAYWKNAVKELVDAGWRVFSGGIIIDRNGERAGKAEEAAQTKAES